LLTRFQPIAIAQCFDECDDVSNITVYHRWLIAKLPVEWGVRNVDVRLKLRWRIIVFPDMA